MIKIWIQIGLFAVFAAISLIGVGAIYDGIMTGQWEFKEILVFALMILVIWRAHRPRGTNKGEDA